jgi:excisionase family DNA binding protein
MNRARQTPRARDRYYHESAMLSVRDACRILFVHENTLRRWGDQWIIRAYRIGPRGDRRFRRDDVAALLVEVTRHSLKHTQTDREHPCADDRCRVPSFAPSLGL